MKTCLCRLLKGISLYVLLGMSMAQGNTLKILMQDGPTSIYSEYASGDILSTFNQAVRGSFFKVGANYDLQPALIKKWYWNAKDQSYTLTLDENARYHDGTRPTSEDIEFSLVRGFFSEKRTFYEIYLGQILGVNKIKPQQVYKPWSIEGIQKIDDLTIKVLLASPNPSFLFSLTRPFFSLTSKRFYNDDLMTFKKWPIGAGKYKIIDEDEYKVTLKNTIESESIDIVQMYKKNDSKAQYDISYLSQKIENQVTSYTDISDSTRAIFFTNQNKLSKNVNFRKAIYYGVNRTELIGKDTSKSPAYSFLSSAHWIVKPNEDTYDLNLAKKYFKKIPQNLLSAWEIPVYEASKSFSKEKSVFADIFEQQMKKIGFNFKLVPNSEKFLSKETAMKSPFRIAGRVADNLDPLLMFGSFRTNSAFKYDDAQNDKIFDQMYIAATKSEGTEERVKTMRALSEYTIKNYFMVPLSENKNTYYFNSLTVKSLGRQPEPLTLNIDLIEMK